MCFLYIYYTTPFGFGQLIRSHRRRHRGNRRCRRHIGRLADGYGWVLGTNGWYEMKKN